MEARGAEVIPSRGAHTRQADQSISNPYSQLSPLGDDFHMDDHDEKGFEPERAAGAVGRDSNRDPRGTEDFTRMRHTTRYLKKGRIRGADSGTKTQLDLLGKEETRLRNVIHKRKRTLMDTDPVIKESEESLAATRLQRRELWEEATESSQAKRESEEKEKARRGLPYLTGPILQAAFQLKGKEDT